MAITTPPAAPSRNNPATFSDRMDAFLAWLVTAVPEFNSLAILANGGTYHVVSSPTDTSFGRLANVGWMGLGSDSGNTIADLNDTTTPNGWWRFDGSTANNTTGSSSGQLLIVRYNNGALTQLAVNAAQFLLRSYSSGAWGAWRRVFTSGNLLSTVTLSAGVPTGGVFERGSNVNGEYARYADGTQICQISGISFTYSDADHLTYSWTYPAAFAAGSVPYRSVFYPNTGGDLTGISMQQIGGLRLGVGVITATQRLYRAQGAANFVGGNQIANCGLFAIGRWA